MTRGVMYMAWGENAVRQAHESMMSLWLHEPKMPVMVLGDRETERLLRRCAPRNDTTFHLVEMDPFDMRGRPGFKFLAGRIKPLMAKISPWDETLYVDADSLFKQSPSPGFERLKLWDLVIACHEKGVGGTDWSNCTERKETSKLIGSPMVLYHNSGMIFWRKNERTEKLFDLWSEEWLKYQHWDEQVALLRALMRSEAVYLNVPISWNSNERKDAYILHHWWGVGHARIEKGRRRPVGTKARHPAFGNRARKLVKVELSPGCWVKCDEGDEEKVRAYFERVMGDKLIVDS